MTAYEFPEAFPDAPPGTLPQIGDDGALIGMDTDGATTERPVVWSPDARGAGKPGVKLGDEAGAVSTQRRTVAVAVGTAFTGMWQLGSLALDARLCLPVRVHGTDQSLRAILYASAAARDAVAEVARRAAGVLANGRPPKPRPDAGVLLDVSLTTANGWSVYVGNMHPVTTHDATGTALYYAAASYMEPVGACDFTLTYEG